MPRTWRAPRRVKRLEVRHEPDHARDARPRRYAADAGVGHSGRVRARRDRDRLSCVLPGLRCAARRGRDVLVRARRIHARRDPDVRDDGRGDRLVAGRQGSLRGARPLALPSARRPCDFESRRLRDLRGADRLVAGLLRGDRQDGHSGDAPPRLSRTTSPPARSARAARSAFSFRRRSPSFSTASRPRPRSAGCSSPACCRA